MKKLKCTNCKGTGFIEVEDNKSFMYYLGQKVKETRENLAWTQEDLASKIGMSRGSIANLERGNQDMPLSKMLTIADKLKISWKDLF